MTTIELIERQTDVLALRREHLDRIDFELKFEAVMMADSLRHENMPRAQRHRRRYDHVLELLGVCLET